MGVPYFNVYSITSLVAALISMEPRRLSVIDVYIRCLRKKLEAGGESRLIYTVRGAGYVMKEEE